MDRLSAPDQGASQGPFEPLGSIGVEINLTATSLATEKISVTTQLATQLHKSRCKSNGLEVY
jgi:hypothetical protein